MQAIRADITLYTTPPLGFKSEIQGTAIGIGITGWVRMETASTMSMWVQHDESLRIQVFFDLLREIAKKRSLDISIDMHPHTPRTDLKQFVIRRDQKGIIRTSKSITSGELAFSDAGSAGFGSESEYLMMRYQRDATRRKLYMDVIKHLEEIKNRASSESRKSVEKLVEETRVRMEKEKVHCNLSVVSNASYIGDDHDHSDDELSIAELERRMEQQRLAERERYFGTTQSTASTSTVINLIMDEKQTAMLNEVMKKAVNLMELERVTSQEYIKFLKLDSAKKLELYVLAEMNKDDVFVMSLKSLVNE